MPLPLTVFQADLVAVAVITPLVALGVPAQAVKDMRAVMVTLLTMLLVAVAVLLLLAQFTDQMLVVLAGPGHLLP
jgi:hypothetical protein